MAVASALVADLDPKAAENVAASLILKDKEPVPILKKNPRKNGTVQLPKNPLKE